LRGRDEKTYRIHKMLVTLPEEKRAFELGGCRWEDNIKLGLIES
jgi:hypothetical protein